MDNVVCRDLDSQVSRQTERQTQGCKNTVIHGLCVWLLKHNLWKLAALIRSISVTQEGTMIS